MEEKTNAETTLEELSKECANLWCALGELHYRKWLADKDFDKQKEDFCSRAMSINQKAFSIKKNQPKEEKKVEGDVING